VAKSWLSIEKTAFSIAAALLLLYPSPGRSDGYRAWTGEFMRMGAGARAMGMGNAYTAVEGDVYGSYFNPAGLSYMTERQFTFSFRYLTMDRMFRYFALASPAGPDAGFAFSWLNAGTDDIVGRDLNGNPTGALTDNRNAFTLSFAKILNRWISLGINVKYGVWKLAGDDAKSFGFDVGVFVRPWRNRTASLTARDLRSRFTWNSKRWNRYISGADGQPMEKEDRFPKYYTAGLAYKALDGKLLVASTLEKIENYPAAIDIGASWMYNETFTLRTGYYRYSPSDDIDKGSFTAGFTLKITRSICFDYAYAADTVADDNVHIVAFLMSYGDYLE